MKRARPPSADVALLRDALATYGLLLVHDTTRPCATALVAGAPVPGSWWAHPSGKRTFDALSELEHDASVLFARALAGKVTLVHASLHAALAAVGARRAAWQTRGLSSGARALLARLDAEGRIEAKGKDTTSLEQRWLALGASAHGETGAHHKTLESWPSVRARLGLAELALEHATAALERAAARTGAGLLPW